MQHFTFNESVSLQVLCDSQDEVDHYWTSLGSIEIRPDRELRP
jgi:predicted 3-demethylubiquinone-9 3-methyltransferase (glyoxalase superfamily)